MPSGFASAPIVILSSIDWDATWQRHQIFASLWADAGHDVYFVENLGFREPNFFDWRRVFTRLSRLLVSPKRRLAKNSNIKIISPAVLPPTREIFRAINAAVFAPRLARRLKKRGLNGPCIVFCYLPTATTLSVLDELPARAVVYDCVDNFAGHPTPPKGLNETEAALLSRVDFALTTSPTLQAALEKKHSDVVELHQGAPDSFFIDARGGSPARKLAYFGTVWSALDFDALAALAAAGFTVDLIGPVKEDVSALPPGVRSLPPVPHARLPEILARYDALLLPYAQTDYNIGVTPAKLYECLATGLPVLAAPLPALKKHKDVLSFAATPQEWVEAARALDPADDVARRRRIQAARPLRQSDVLEKLRELTSRAWNHPKPRPAPAPRGAGAQEAATMAVFYVLAKLATMATQIVTGRILGPEEFGRANIIIAGAAYLQIAPMLGFPSSTTRHLAAAEPGAKKSELSTAFGLFALWALISLPALWFLREPTARLIGLPTELASEAYLLAALTAIYTVVSGGLLGFKRLKDRGAVELLYGLSVPALFLFFGGLGDHRDYVRALEGALVAAASVALFRLYRSFGKFDWSRAKPILVYAALASFNFLAAALIVAPGRLALQTGHGPLAVGMFSAYFSATMQIALAISTLLVSIILPLAAGVENQKTARAHVARFWIPAWLLSFAVFWAAAVVALALFGRQYQLQPLLAALFAAAAATHLTQSVLGCVLAAEGIHGLVPSVSAAVISGAVNALLCAALVPRYGLAGTAWALLGGFATGTAICALALIRKTR